MKRHNLLLMSYIIFAVICIIVRVYVEFGSWNYVVSAVAVSSAFLAYADFFYVHSKYYADSCDMAERFIIIRGKKIKKEKSIIEDISIKITELKTKGLDLSQDEVNMEEAQKGCSEMEKILSDLKKGIDLKRKKQKRYSFCADMLTLLAFLSFLCLVTFTDIAVKIGKAQDFISIIAFVIVLSSQYVNSIFSEKQIRDKKNHEHAIATHDVVHEKIFEMQSSFNIYYERMEDYAN